MAENLENIALARTALTIRCLDYMSALDDESRADLACIGISNAQDVDSLTLGSLADLGEMFFTFEDAGVREYRVLIGDAL